MLKKSSILIIVFVLVQALCYGQSEPVDYLHKDLYAQNCRQLISPGLLDKIELIQVESFPPRSTSSCLVNSTINQSNFYIHSVGEKDDFINYTGLFSPFSLSGAQNGLLLRTHSTEFLANPSSIKRGVIENTVFEPMICDNGYLSLNSIYATANPLLPVTQEMIVDPPNVSYACEGIDGSKLITAGGIFRDFLMASSQAYKFNFEIAKSQNNLLTVGTFNTCEVSNCGCYNIRRKTYNKLSSVTFFRVWFKLKERKSVTDANRNEKLKIYANFKLLGNVFYPATSPSKDIFSIRVMKKTADYVNFPKSDEHGFTVSGCNSNTYCTIPTIPLVLPLANPPETLSIPFFRSISLDRKVEDQVIRATEKSDDALNELGFNFQSKMYSYSCDLDYPSSTDEGVYSIIVGVADCGETGFGDISGLLVQLSDAPIIENIGPCGQEGYLGYTPPCCNTEFSPQPGKKYKLQGWYNVTQPVDASCNEDTRQIQIKMDFDSRIVAPEVHSCSTKSLNEWVRFEYPFTMPPDANIFDLEVKIKDGCQFKALIDDIRIIPIDSEVKSYVYDSESGKLKSELDSQNYAVHYTYDETGRLVRTSKETSKGVKTINIKIEDE